MHAEVADLIHVSNRWLARFESALAGRSDETLESLFHSDSHWRDILALTWCIKTVSGSSAIARALKTHADNSSGSTSAARAATSRTWSCAASAASRAVFMRPRSSR